MFLAVVVCVIFVAAPALGQVTATTLPAYHASGATPYELGVAVGGLAKESYQALILADDSINTVLRPWAAAHPADFAAFRRNNAQFYADIAEELRGMAAGAGVSEEDVWLLMLRPEIEALASRHRRPNASSSSSASDEEENSASDGPLPKLFSGEACMDVLLRPKSSALDVLLGHNEDWNAVYKRFGFLLYERQPFAEANGSATEIAAFTYPLTSSGFTFGWNSAGVVTSCNALGPLNINIGGLGRYFVNRDVLASLSIDDAIARLRRAAPHVAFGFALSVGCVGSRRLVHTETAPSGVVDVLELQPGTALVHANKYTHDAFNNIEQWYSTSTDHRLRRAAQLSPPENSTSVLGILGDTNDIDGSGHYPIYRSGAPPDDSGTVATALFDLGTGTVAIYGDNPKQTAPLAVLPLFAPPGWGTSQTASLELRLFWPLVGIAAGALLIAVVSLSILASLCRNPLPRRRYTPINSSS